MLLISATVAALRPSILFRDELIFFLKFIITCLVLLRVSDPYKIIELRLQFNILFLTDFISLYIHNFPTVANPILPLYSYFNIRFCPHIDVRVVEGLKCQAHKSCVLRSIPGNIHIFFFYLK